jgi:hypothetical protein
MLRQALRFLTPLKNHPIFSTTSRQSSLFAENHRFFQTTLSANIGKNTAWNKLYTLQTTKPHYPLDVITKLQKLSEENKLQYNPLLEKASHGFISVLYRIQLNLDRLGLANPLYFNALLESNIMADDYFIYGMLNFKERLSHIADMPDDTKINAISFIKCYVQCIPSIIRLMTVLPWNKVEELLQSKLPSVENLSHIVPYLTQQETRYLLDNLEQDKKYLADLAKKIQARPLEERKISTKDFYSMLAECKKTDKEKNKDYAPICCRKPW